MAGWRGASMTAGHTDGPNWTYFIRWADTFLMPADRPVSRVDENSLSAQPELLDKAKKRGIDIYFVGDSIARAWGATDYPDLLANWTKNFFGWNAADFGWGADKTQHILWRLEHGGARRRQPEDHRRTGRHEQRGHDAADRRDDRGRHARIKAILDACRRKAPRAAIVLTAIFPRNDNLAVMPAIDRINRNIARFADGKTVRFLNVNDKLADGNGGCSTHDERA